MRSSVHHFLDSSGADAPLGVYFQQRPVVMALVYYKCRMLCPQVLSGMAKTLRQVTFAPGKDYDIVVVSIDPDTKQVAMFSLPRKHAALWRGHRNACCTGVQAHAPLNRGASPAVGNPRHHPHVTARTGDGTRL